ncbi:MAG: iron-sulfur cluster assembly scaffold protein [Anaerolineae bacterium]|nr:iron-sulfur cluster assembly scaffold protein [Anaerolineae bacterium]
MTPSPYRERILDHYQRPRHRGSLEAPLAVGEIDNPVCGDQVRIAVRLDADERVTAAFDGEGCILSMAAASMLAEHVQGRPLSDVRALTDQDILDLMEVELGPVRVKCALLPLRALQAALEELEDR